jgi:hypothetical protein
MRQAWDLTAAIRSTGEVLYALLARAHAGRAWVVLGYPTFGHYVRAEFNMSRSRAYQLLDQARVVSAIESALPEGARIPDLTEAAARDLKSTLDEVLGEIRERLANESAAETDKIVMEIVGNYRRLRDPDERPRRSAAVTNDALHRLEDPWVAAERTDRRTSQVASDLTLSLTALGSMPDPGVVIEQIPPDRHKQIDDAIDAATAWLQDFKSHWKAHLDEAPSPGRRTRSQPQWLA